MKIISTNIGAATTFLWNGKEEQTGIYKYPANQPLFLGKTDVENDTVVDRKHHGGIHKACFLFASEHYEYWKAIYPNLKWDWGMFGENLTTEGMDDSTTRIGDVYRIGTALVQISTPREPCYKLKVRFNDPHIIEKYLAYGKPGTYVRILEEGSVVKGDTIELVQQSTNTLTVAECFTVILSKHKNPFLLQKAINNLAVPEYKRLRLLKYL
ncbi:MOSC domain-containing protein [Arenibacter certesii]|uniref:Molybdenum cofactor biosysynthesis protein n=1 Tax=Arenibacter certesii TaxID=228955 RepID=A0A918J5B0_9FLAO|nr:MOSC domain-containing protein [Arenibacter certesii]GGW45027.1 molybdenum cofactor biosysynthesis protein [Arenibacter certesii]